MQPTDYLARILPAKVAHILGEGLGIHTVADLIYHFPRRYIHGRMIFDLSLIHISEPTRREWLSRMPSSA